MPDFSKLRLPDWVRFVAQDKDGTWWGYEVEPLPNDEGWYENEVGRYIKIQNDNFRDNWRESLLKIKT